MTSEELANLQRVEVELSAENTQLLRTLLEELAQREQRDAALIRDLSTVMRQVEHALASDTAPDLDRMLDGIRRCVEQVRSG